MTPAFALVLILLAPGAVLIDATLGAGSPAAGDARLVVDGCACGAPGMGLSRSLNACRNDCPRSGTPTFADTASGRELLDLTSAVWDSVVVPDLDPDLAGVTAYDLFRIWALSGDADTASTLASNSDPFAPALPRDAGYLSPAGRNSAANVFDDVDLDASWLRNPESDYPEPESLLLTALNAVAVAPSPNGPLLPPPAPLSTEPRPQPTPDPFPIGDAEAVPAASEAFPASAALCDDLAAECGPRHLAVLALVLRCFADVDALLHESSRYAIAGSCPPRLDSAVLGADRIDVVAGHYVGVFGRDDAGPWIRTAADARYCYSLQSMLLCFYLHCVGRADAFRQRHAGVAQDEFFRQCRGDADYDLLIRALSPGRPGPVPSSDPGRTNELGTAQTTAAAPGMVLESDALAGLCVSVLRPSLDIFYNRSHLTDWLIDRHVRALDALLDEVGLYEVEPAQTRKLYPLETAAVPRLANVHYDRIDLVAAHYVRQFRRRDEKLRRIDIDYRRSLQCIIVCYYLHCGSCQAEFAHRHSSLPIASFHHFCTGYTICNFEEKTASRDLSNQSRALQTRMKRQMKRQRRN